MILAIDTSTRVATVALSADGTVLAELTWRSEQHHTRELLPNLAHVLRQVVGNDPLGTALPDDAGRVPGLDRVAGIAVATGPGSFNGLRVGVGSAKALAFTLGRPIVGVSTLAAHAYQHAYLGLPVCAILGAGRTEIASAIYRLVDGRWQEERSPAIGRLEDLLAEIEDRTVFCGELVEAQTEQIAARLGGRAVLVPSVASLRRAGYLADLGARLLAAGQQDDPATLQPLYLRRPPIGERKSSSS